MIYSVHFWYKKIHSRKASNKFEGLVFAKDNKRVEELIRDMISNYPIEAEGYFSIMGPAIEKTLQEIYEERPDLTGISPEKGCIIGESSQRNTIQRYLK